MPVPWSVVDISDTAASGDEIPQQASRKQAIQRAALVLLLLAVGLAAGLYAALAGGSPGSSHSARHGTSAASSAGLFNLPGAAQGPISETLGANSPAYRVQPRRDGFAATSPLQRLHLRFRSSGVAIGSGATRFGLGLREIGSGTALTPLAQVAPRARGNRVVYDRPGLSEWYSNGPLGLEQGFTVAKAPAGAGSGPLTLSLAVSGNASAGLVDEGQSVVLRNHGGPALRYSGLRATDASGRLLHGWLTLEGSRLLLHVDTRGARYPVRIDPFVQQGEKLTGTGAKGEEGAFGFSVALSANGNTALIGGWDDNGRVGAAWVFTREGTTWTQQGPKLTGKGESGKAEFGWSVALGPEGNTALIGGPSDVGPGANGKRTGAAWVFTRSGSTWTQQGAKLTAKAGEELGPGEFGGSVAISSKTGASEEAATALIGAPNDGKEIEVEGKKQLQQGYGSAFVFTRSGTTWTQQGAKLVPSEPEIGAKFGESAALGAEGSTALVGSPGKANFVGAAWVFTRSGTTWSQQAKLLAKEGEELGSGSFGAGVALGVLGNTALIGAPSDNTSIGAAFVFTRSGTTWTQQGAKLTGSGESGEGLFGSSVALSSKPTEEASTSTALIGGPGDSGFTGAAWVFTRSGTTWTQQAKLTAKAGEEVGAGEFGESVALGAEGATALAGAPDDRLGVGGGVGAAWVFTRSGTTWTQQGGKLTAKSGEESGEGESPGRGEFGYSVAVSEDGNTALVGGPMDNNAAGAAWVFTRSEGKWTQQGAKLTAKTGEESAAGQFGRAVAIAYKGGNTALIGTPSDNGSIGAAFVFTRSGTTWTQQGAKLVAKAGEETGAGEFGTSVALSSEGNDAVMGARGDNSSLGAAWVYTRSGSTWTQQGSKLVAKAGEETAGGAFGASVSVSSEGGNLYALIGAPFDKEFVGSAWVFIREGTTWKQQARVLPKEKEEIGGGEFGTSTSMAPEGARAVVGAPGDKENLGSAWVFTRSGTNWTQEAKLLPKEKEEIGIGRFGASVAQSIEKEPKYSMVGAPWDNSMVGAAWVFKRSGTAWTQQGTKLTANSTQTGAAEFGATVALSSETAATALMGSPQDNEEIGAAWAFTRSGETWTQQGEKLTGSGESGQGEAGGKGEFGYGVAVSADGNTALIGGPAAIGGGAAWVFTREGATWKQQGTPLIGAGESRVSKFGSSVALSSDGNTALVGGRCDPGEKNGCLGSAWVFTRSEGKWTQQGAKLRAKEGEETEGGEFGSSVALSGDGNTALVGAPQDGPFPIGAAWVYARSEGKWTQQGEKLYNPGVQTVGAQLGSGVALSSNGNTAFLGAPGQSENAGAAWVYTRSGSTWTKQAGPVTVTGESGKAGAGRSVALSSDGNTALLGGPGDQEGNSEGRGGVGATWVLTRSGSTWTQQGSKLVAKAGEETGKGEFGSSVALSSNGGNTAVVGAPADKEGTGAAWAFGRSGVAWTQVGSKITGSGAVLPTHLGQSVAVSSEGSTALLGGYTDNVNVGATWAFLNEPPTVVTEEASPVGQTTATLKAKVNPHGNEVTECRFEYGTTESYGSTAPCTPSPGSGSSPVEVHAELTGLGGNTTYHFRVVAISAGGTSNGLDKSFKTALGSPIIVTQPATGITQTEATLNGTVNPEGSSVTECKFEYGTTTSYGSSVACTSLPGGGISPVPESVVAKGLSPKTTYHFRLVATNGGGTKNGPDETFKTLPNAPKVLPAAASSVTPTGATLNATVNPEGGEVTECFFEWGEGEKFNVQTPCSSLPGKGEVPVEVSAAVSGLTENTTYKFRIVAKNAGGTSTSSAETFTTPEKPKAPSVGVENAVSVTSTSATLTGAVKPNGAEVTECVYEYSTSPAFTEITTKNCSELPGSGNKFVEVRAEVTALTPNTTYYFRLSAKNSAGRSTSGTETFKTLPAAPTVVTEPAMSITETSATLKGTVNPNSGEVTNCQFEYGTTEVYTNTVSCSSLPGSGSSPVAVSAPLPGLKANTTYHFRISATNAGGTGKGGDRSFKTRPVEPAPTVVTGAAWSVQSTSALLNATVNPNLGTVSECKFEYGTTTSYGLSATCSSLPGSGETPVAVSAAISGLSPATTYHYRISATDPGGTSRGSDREFTTAPTPVARHWYRNGSKATAGLKVPMVFWGGATNVSFTSSAGEMNCKTAGAGTAENPTGGGVGVGEVIEYMMYECKAPQCEALVKEKFGTTGRGGVGAANLPWHAEVFEGGAPMYDRLRIGEPFALPFGSPKAGEMKVKAVCEVVSTHTVVSSTAFEGEVQPEIGVAAENLNGPSAAKPSTMHFAGPSGGSVYSEPALEGSFAGAMKYLGYVSQEVMSVSE
jgi:phosphodiesterase/alkaline phosphatase D-like protein